jgi:hypothetical protein
MTLETVSNIEFSSSDGLLVVRLDGGGEPSYQHVYRVAAGIYWDNDAGAFKFNMKSDNNLVQWFAHIREVLEDEMDIRLRLDSRTTWKNVPSNIQHEIELAYG